MFGGFTLSSPGERGSGWFVHRRPEFIHRKWSKCSVARPFTPGGPGFFVGGIMIEELEFQAKTIPAFADELAKFGFKLECYRPSSRDRWYHAAMSRGVHSCTIMFDPSDMRNSLTCVDALRNAVLRCIASIHHDIIKEIGSALDSAVPAPLQSSPKRLNAAEMHAEIMGLLGGIGNDPGLPGGDHARS